MKWLLAAYLIAAAALFPYSLNRIQAKGYDFPIYYKAGQGDISTDYAKGAYVYNGKTAAIFWPLARLPMWLAFGIFYAATVVALVWLLFGLCRVGGQWPHLAALAGLLLGGASLIILRCGNINGLLAVLCISPLGSVLAGCVKPYLWAFTAVHAAIFCHRHSQGAPGQVPTGQTECGLSGGAVGGAGPWPS